MYKYIYVESTVAGVFKTDNHREIIESYSKEGWRFISAIPTKFDPTFGSPTKFDLIFEKTID